MTRRRPKHAAPEVPHQPPCGTSQRHGDGPRDGAPWVIRPSAEASGQWPVPAHLCGCLGAPVRGQLLRSSGAKQSGGLLAPCRKARCRVHDPAVSVGCQRRVRGIRQYELCERRTENSGRRHRERCPEWFIGGWCLALVWFTPTQVRILPSPHLNFPGKLTSRGVASTRLPFRRSHHGRWHCRAT